MSAFLNVFFLFSAFFNSSEIMNKSLKKLMVFINEKVWGSSEKIEEYFGNVMSDTSIGFCAEIDYSSFVP